MTFEISDADRDQALADELKALCTRARPCEDCGLSSLWVSSTAVGWGAFANLFLVGKPEVVRASSAEEREEIVLAWERHARRVMMRELGAGWQFSNPKFSQQTARRLWEGDCRCSLSE